MTAPTVPSDTMPTESMPLTGQRVALHTLGCKANQLETSTLANQFRAEGWELVPFDEPAEMYVINTCTVTERSDQESRRMIRRAHLSNPEGRIAVTGCYAQVAPEELAALDGVDFVIGNQFKEDLLRIVEAPSLDGKPMVKVSDIDKSRIMTGASSAAPDRTRGSLKIQDGCDFKCTYCIIWEARGQSRSLPVDDIRYQLGRMLFDGFKEIMLTGINIGQYEHEGYDLADLLEELIALPGIFRLRLTSLDPVEVTDKLIRVVAESNGKICPHFHLSAQSAEDYVLRRMGRRHHVSDMQHVCEEISRQMPHASVGSDIIVGFPGETTERFEATFETLRAVPMNYFHVFSYSKRRGTPAASFPEQVPERDKKNRAKRLRALSDEKQTAYRSRFIGQTLDIIVENGTTEDADALPLISTAFEPETPLPVSGTVRGMSENYLKLKLDWPAGTPQPPANTRLSVHVTHLLDEETWAVPLDVSARI